MNNLSAQPFGRIISLLFVTVSLTMFGQNKEMKFGKVNHDELTMTQCPIDSAAEAVVLCDIGQSYFEYSDSKGFELIFERHLRIKILKSDGYGWATLSIPLYSDGHAAEQVTVLKGKTYNLVNGKVEETKLDNGSVFEENVNDYWKKKKISLPGVKEGSVFEIKYTVKSPFLQRIRDWRFQFSIPVLWSEYELRIPEYYKFSRNATGYVPFVVNESGSAPQSITLTTSQNAGTKYVQKTEFQNTTISFIEYRQRLAAANIPAMKEEPFTTSVENYQAEIEYELHSYKYPGGIEHNFTESWEDVITQLLNDEDFGAQLKRKNLVKKQAEEIRNSTTDPIQQARLALEATRSVIKWDGAFTKYSDEGLSAALSKGAGNSADVNLYLVLLMDEIGLNAVPVILSTRENGFIQEHHPEINGFNYVIACVTVNGKDYLLDATEKFTPFGLISYRCLNGKGLTVVKPGFRWVDLSASEPNGDLYYAEMNLDSSGRMSGILTVSSAGYNGAMVRGRFFTEGEKEYSRWLREQRKNWEITGIEFESPDSLETPVKIVYTLASDEVAENQGGLVFFNVLLTFGQSSNPFKKEKRDYPVDFGAPIKDAYSFTYEIPEGYQVESLPGPIAIALPEKAGTFRFSASIIGNNKIVVNSLLDIKKTLFVPSEYDKLRELFARIVEKHSEQIVLKKL
ncbi:MAG: DUF3857 domain-containing protein [Bacteroidales bacterium]|nr:DUF3857 domain-containing protein [Bacteroidales bacterium]